MFIFCRFGNFTPAINLTSAGICFEGLGMCVGVFLLCVAWVFFTQTPHTISSPEDMLRDALLEDMSVTFWLEAWYLVAAYRESFTEKVSRVIFKL